MSLCGLHITAANQAARVRAPTVNVEHIEHEPQLVISAGLAAERRQQAQELLEVDALEEKGQPLRQRVDGQLGDAQELIGGDEALRGGRFTGGRRARLLVSAPPLP